MDPKRLSAELRRVSAKIEASKQPSKKMVMEDLRRILAAVQNPRVGMDENVDFDMLKQLKPKVRGGELELRAKDGEVYDLEYVLGPGATWRNIMNPEYGYDTGFPAIEVTVNGQRYWFDQSSTERWYKTPVGYKSQEYNDPNPGNF